MSKRGEYAKQLGKEGYNCSQAVFLAFAEDYGLSRSAALKLSSSFGGGFGQKREVCGAVCGMVMALGLIEGYDDPKGRDAHYKKVRDLIDEFSAQNGGYICRELLALGKKRSCPESVYSAVEILENYLNQKENEQAK